VNRALVGMAVGLLTWPAGAAAQLVMTSEMVAPGVHLIAGFTNGNILVIEGRDGVLLVDAQSPRRVGLADSVLRTITSAPVRTVVFTHYHEDHTGGMPHWREGGATAVGQASVPAQMVKDTIIADWEDWHRTPAAPGALPDRTFADRLTLDAGGVRVELIHIPLAHTDGDAIVWLPELNVLHSGDLVEPGGAPFIDWWAGGSLDGMIAAADQLLALVNDSTRIVPGHGPVIGRETLAEHRRMLVTLRDAIGSQVRQGRMLDQVLAARPAAEFERLLGGPRRADQFVRLVYYGLARSGTGNR
jgi:cyclase